MEKLQWLYQRLSKFTVLFNDFGRGNPEAFLQKFIHIHGDGTIEAIGLIWEVDDIGIFFLTDFIPHYGEAQAHFTFWDRRFEGRVGLARKMVEYVFEEIGLRVIRAEIPLYTPATLTFAEEIGFKKEGRRRKAVRYKDQWFDCNLYSILREEAL